MSTSILYHAFGIKSVQYLSTAYQKNTVIYHVEMKNSCTKCPKCHDEEHHQFKGQKERLLKMQPIGQRECFLQIKLHRLKCSCSHVWWPCLHFMKGKYRMTTGFMRYAMELLKISTIQDISGLLRVSWNVLKNLHKMKLEKMYKEISIEDLEYLSVDEIAIRKGHDYMTIFSDIRSGNILHAIEGRTIEVIAPFLQKLGKEAKKLKAIAMDLSNSYSSAVRSYLPHVDIVFDHFHVDALMNKALDDVRKEQQEKLNQHEHQVLKGNRFLLLRNYGNLNEEFKIRLDELLAANEPLFKTHTLKEQLKTFWDKSTKEEGEIFLNQWLADAATSAIPQLRKIVKTFTRHKKGLLAYFTHRISNAKAEGINNKIKTMKRQAYGYRDMEYFKLRLYHLHEQRYSFVG